jgi:transcriptional regulator of aromatic amino acid metabolism
MMTRQELTNKKWDNLAREHGFDNEKQMLATLYRDHSTASLAEELEVTSQTICTRLSRNGIPRRPKGGRNHYRRKF